MPFQCGRYRLNLDRPLIMGIVNVTPDSFSGDGLGGDTQAAIEYALRLVEEGADLLDIGGESSRPGAHPVDAAAELERVIPVIEGLRDCGAPLSVDTAKPEVMRAALAAGADLINDICALGAEGALAAAAASNCGVCLMHMQGEPRTMQVDPHYADVVAEVERFLLERAARAEAAGIARERLMLDLGFGFGKSLAHNLALLRALPRLTGHGYPVAAGLSRKSMLGQITGRPVGERVPASIAAALLAAERGATVLRVHDVAATCDALAVWQALQLQGEHR